MDSRPFRIGTRGSRLALAQAHEVRARLMAAHALPQDAFEVVVISTAGDRIQDRALSEVGGKGLFTFTLPRASAPLPLSLVRPSALAHRTVPVSFRPSPLAHPPRMA